MRQDPKEHPNGAESHLWWMGRENRKLDFGDCVILQDEKLQNGFSCFLTDCFGNLERKREKRQVHVGLSTQGMFEIESKIS